MLIINILSNAERLEQIKNKPHLFTSHDEQCADKNWLIERVEETEKYAQVVSKDADYYVGRSKTLEYENARLREALEEISEMYSDGKSPVLDHWGMLTIAKSALEETK